MNKTVTQAIFKGYWGVIPKNMALPVALFMSEAEAIEYANGTEVRKYPTSSLLFEALCQSGNNP